MAKSVKSSHNTSHHSKRDLHSESQKIIIPKGVINPHENIVVEVPNELKKQPVVVVRTPEKLPDVSANATVNTTGTNSVLGSVSSASGTTKCDSSCPYVQNSYNASQTQPQHTLNQSECRRPVQTCHRPTTCLGNTSCNRCNCTSNSFYPNSECQSFSDLTRTSCDNKPQCCCPKMQCDYPKPQCDYPKTQCDYPKMQCDHPKPLCDYPKQPCDFSKSQCDYPRMPCDYPKPQQCNYPKMPFDYPKLSCVLSKPQCGVPKLQCTIPKPLCEYHKPNYSLPRLHCDYPKLGCDLPHPSLFKLSVDSCNSSSLIKLKQLLKLEETERLERQTLNDNLCSFQNARRRIILDSKDFGSNISLNDSLLTCSEDLSSFVKPSPRRSDNLEKLLSDVKDLSKVLSNSCTNLKHVDSKPSRNSLFKPFPVRDSASCSNVSDTEDQEIAEVESALREFQKARRKLIAMMQECSSAHSMPILKKSASKKL